MNNIQMTCDGNLLTKPLICWSFLDSTIVLCAIVLGTIITLTIYERTKK